jgi:hypothetical protein
MPKLSPTEQRVADLISQGLSIREVANAMYLSPNTVSSFLGRIRIKQPNFPTLLEIRRSPGNLEKFGYRIGSLCKRGHRYMDTDQSLRNADGMCVECDRISNSGTYYRKKQRQQQKAG